MWVDGTPVVHVVQEWLPEDLAKSREQVDCISSTITTRRRKADEKGSKRAKPITYEQSPWDVPSRYAPNFYRYYFLVFINIDWQRVCGFILTTIWSIDYIAQITGRPIPLHELPRWFSGKESACQAGDVGSIPESGRYPLERKWQPILVFLPGESHGQRTRAGYSLLGRKESDVT